jgi:predicted AlkP superfamily phosphohydrolase/phosphomutase
MNDGVWGTFESCIPAITVPAWSSMLTSKDPGTLGFYGFRNRGDYSYEKYTLANANSVKRDRVWDILSRAGKKVITIGVPQIYPPKPMNGIQEGSSISPSTNNEE